MTCKDYKKFAAMIRDVDRMRRPGQVAVPYDSVELFKRFTADIFAADNPHFDRERFIKACEVKEQD